MTLFQEVRPAAEGLAHEHVLALDKLQVAQVHAVMEERIEGPHGDVLIVGGAEMQRLAITRNSVCRSPNVPSVGLRLKRW